MKGHTSPRGEGLCRHQRLRRRADYLRCYRRGRKRHGSLASLHFHSNEGQDVRLGVTASRKVGNAVIRHRLKRRIREVFRRFGDRDRLGPMDIVIHLKPMAAGAVFADLAAEVGRLLRSLLPRTEQRQ